MVNVTLKQVAELANVDAGTASRVLNRKAERAGIGRERARRVRQAARQLGYRPNAFARGVRAGRFGAAALVLSADLPGRSTLPQMLLSGLVRALERHNMHLTIAELLDEDLTDERFVPKLLREWMSDGLLVNYNREFPPRMVELVENHALPAVWINAKRDHDCVHPDDLNGGREATRRLLELGHRRITYVSFTSDRPEARHYSEVDRYEGYAQVMREAGQSTGMIHPRSPGASRDGRQTLYEAVERVLSGPRRPTAFVSYGFSTPIVRAADRMGLSIPRDLSLIRFAGAGSEEAPATMVVPEAEIARQAVEMLMAKIEDPGRRLAPRAVPFGFHPGMSLAPPPDAA